MRLIGFRAHQLLDPEGAGLFAVNTAYGVWRRGQNEARNTGTHGPLVNWTERSALSTTYGFHAYYALNFPLEHPQHVLSAVTGWGRMVLHRDGWRAQFAEIHAVLSTQDRVVDNAIRKRYDVPVVTYSEELREIALKYGIEVSDPAAEMAAVWEIEKADPAPTPVPPPLHPYVSLGDDCYPKKKQEIEALVGRIDLVPTITSGKLEVRDLYELHQALPPRFRPRAMFLANRAIYNAIRRLVGFAADGSLPQDGPVTCALFGYPCFAVSAMPATHASGDVILLFFDPNYYKKGGIWQPETQLIQAMSRLAGGPFDGDEAFRALVVQ
jgi:hypothetical protein